MFDAAFSSRSSHGAKVGAFQPSGFVDAALYAELPAGTYKFVQGLSSSVDNIVLR